MVLSYMPKLYRLLIQGLAPFILQELLLCLRLIGGEFSSSKEMIKINYSFLFLFFYLYLTSGLEPH